MRKKGIIIDLDIVAVRPMYRDFSLVTPYVSIELDQVPRALDTQFRSGNSAPCGQVHRPWEEEPGADHLYELWCGVARKRAGMMKVIVGSSHAHEA
jgi:hypothetical protein